MAKTAVFKKSKDRYMASIPQSELIYAMTELSSGAYRLLMYYYSKNDGYVFSEASIAKDIGTSERQVKKFRKELIDKEYLLIQFGQTDLYFIGKKAVEKFKNPESDEPQVSAKEPVYCPKEDKDNPFNKANIKQIQEEFDESDPFN